MNSYYRSPIICFRYDYRMGHGIKGHRMLHRKLNNAVQPSAAHSAHVPFLVGHPMSPLSIAGNKTG